MEAPPLERKLASILAADVAGYSRLMEADEEATLATLSSHQWLIDEEIISHRGRLLGALARPPFLRLPVAHREPHVY
jgi:class 3 adenylate cyclase